MSAKISRCVGFNCPLSNQCARYDNGLNNSDWRYLFHGHGTPYDHAKGTCDYYIAGRDIFQGKSKGGKGTVSKLKQFIEAVVQDLWNIEMPEDTVRQSLVRNLRRFKIQKAHLLLEEPNGGGMVSRIILEIPSSIFSVSSPSGLLSIEIHSIIFFAANLYGSDSIYHLLYRFSISSTKPGSFSLVSHRKSKNDFSTLSIGLLQ